jgi:BMFP domain-containing protein YqiC
MINLGNLDEIVNRLTDALPPGTAQLRDDVEARFRTVLKSAFEKMDLVTREEFEQQKALLERAQVRLLALQQQVDQMDN